jgi:hypothetical protein
VATPQIKSQEDLNEPIRFSFAQARRYVTAQLGHILSPDEIDRQIGYHLERTTPGVERQGRAHTQVILRQEARAPLSRLLTSLRAVADEKPQALQHGQQLAERIVTDPQAVKKLMTKAHRFSPRTR